MGLLATEFSHFSLSRLRKSDTVLPMAQVLTPLQPSFGKENKLDEERMVQISQGMTKSPEMIRSKRETKMMSSLSKHSNKNSVTFGLIIVREYKMTMGDNPSVSYGAPVQLDWEYQEQEEQDLEEYEKNRRIRRSLRHLVLNHYQRTEILEAAGFSHGDIRRAQAEMNRLKRQRYQTQTTAPASEVTQAVVAVGSKVKNLFGRKKKKAKQ